MLPDASVTHKDLDLEIDAMQGRAPGPGVVDAVAAQFASAPNASLVPPNPNGQAGITLHATLSDTTLGRQSFQNGLFVTTAGTALFDSLKQVFFGSNAERTQANWDSIAAARNRVYRYCIFGDAIGAKRCRALRRTLAVATSW